MFRDEYVPPVEREQLVHEFLTLKQGNDSVTVVTQKFHERAMFCPEQVSIEQTRMSPVFGYSEEGHSGVRVELDVLYIC